MRLFIFILLLFLSGCGQEYKAQAPKPVQPRSESVVQPPPPIVALNEKSQVQTQRTKPQHHRDMTDMIDRMARANMVFSISDRVNIDQAVTAELVIDVVRTLDDMERQLRGRMPAAKANIPVTKVMEANLVSSDFRVTAVTPTRQPLGIKAPTRWIWDLETSRGGPHQVSLAINAIITVDGERLQKTVQVYERTIMVEVTAQQHIRRFVSANWQWLWGVIFMPLVIAGWRWLHRRPPKCD